MTLDIPHMIASTIVIFAVVYGVNRTTLFKNLSRGRKALVTFAVLFLALMIMNLFWPYPTIS